MIVIGNCWRIRWLMCKDFLKEEIEIGKKKIFLCDLVVFKMNFKIIFFNENFFFVFLYKRKWIVFVECKIV